jgi:hypothetical protein
MISKEQLSHYGFPQESPSNSGDGYGPMPNKTIELQHAALHRSYNCGGRKFSGRRESSHSGALASS